MCEGYLDRFNREKSEWAERVIALIVGYRAKKPDLAEIRAALRGQEPDAERAARRMLEDPGVVYVLELSRERARRGVPVNGN